MLFLGGFIEPNRSWYLMAKPANLGAHPILVCLTTHLMQHNGAEFSLILKYIYKLKKVILSLTKVGFVQSLNLFECIKSVPLMDSLWMDMDVQAILRRLSSLITIQRTDLHPENFAKMYYDDVGD